MKNISLSPKLKSPEGDMNIVDLKNVAELKPPIKYEKPPWLLNKKISPIFTNFLDHL